MIEEPQRNLRFFFYDAAVQGFSAQNKRAGRNLLEYINEEA